MGGDIRDIDNAVSLDPGYKNLLCYILTTLHKFIKNMCKFACILCSVGNIQSKYTSRIMPVQSQYYSCLKQYISISSTLIKKII